MRNKTGFVAAMIVAAIVMAFCVFAQTPADTQKQVPQQKVILGQKSMEERVFKLEMKLAEMERRLDVLENKLRP